MQLRGVIVKKILTVYTGGTICCASDGKKRNLEPVPAKRALTANFYLSNSPYSKMTAELFEDSDLESEYQTLSENMTLLKLEKIVKHIKKFDFSKYSGVIVLHGTDTLAFTAAFFSMIFSDIPVPMMLVSGSRPPEDMIGNANDNFRGAVELILNGISPNVYVPYRNSDGSMRLYLASALMQCQNYSDDFYCASSAKSFLIKRGETFYTDDKEKCERYSKNRNKAYDFLNSDFSLSDEVIILTPYTGFDYSRVCLEGVKVIIHSTFHSGTICVERNSSEMTYTKNSVLYLAERCQNLGIKIFACPCKLDNSQYSSAFDMWENGKIIPLDMTCELAYAKAVLGISKGFEGDKLEEFMKTEINNETNN